MVPLSFKRCFLLVPLIVCLAGPARGVGYVETFEDGINDDDWRLTTSNDPVIEPTGGNPDAYLYQEIDSATPTWVPLSDTGAGHFIGDYAGLGVTGMSFDLNIFAGIGVPNRNVTLNIGSTFGTGNYLKSVTAYYIGVDISRLPRDWHTYSFKIDSLSPVIPPGWKVFRGNGHEGHEADWQALMQDVEWIGFELGTPGYFYPVWVWDLGIDNIRIW